MIKIDRNRVSIPKILGPDEKSWGKVQTAQAIKFYKEPIESRKRSNYPFTAFWDGTVMDALNNLFYGKCAYCETKMEESDPTFVMHYRPKGGVIGANGEHYPDHYYWLTNEWTNLLLACIDCNMSRNLKGPEGKLMISSNQFPVKDEKNRASLLTVGKDLKNEEAIILNPCEDDPAEHLIFVEDGTVVSETYRGQLTIEIRGLNRKALVDARHQKILQIKTGIVNLNLYREIQDSIYIKEAFQKLGEFRQPHQEYAGLARQFLSSYPLLSSYPHRKETESFEIDQEQIDEIEKSQNEMQHQVKKATKAFKTFRKEQQQYSLESEEGIEKYFSGPARFVEEVSIRNLKSIKHLDINLTGGGKSDVTWTMILGENGTGKSTILQAISIALIGQSYFNELVEKKVFDPASFLRWGAEKGSVSLRISGFPKPRKVFFYNGGRVEFTDSESAQNLLLAYGSTRLMPRGKDDIEYGRNYARVENLFNPFLPMANANLWLTSLPTDKFNYTALKLKELLKLPKNNVLIPRDNIVYLSSVDGDVPISNLSDGYQSTLALIADILKIVLSQWPTPELAQGIVLLDEVGNHLHPEWKMRFVTEMRTFFPKLQFIASTHNPLCLYGLEDGEVVVLRRTNRGSIYQVEDVPSITGLRVDQILTSEHFGLGSVTDQGTQDKMDEYYKLLRSKIKNEAKGKKIRDLKTEIDERQQLGKTERERMLLEVIDQFLAEKRFKRLTSEKKKLKEETMVKLRNIWNSNIQQS